MQARFFDEKSGRCSLCARRCRISGNSRGFCGVRGNGETLTYGRLTAAGADPIEKKPLYHFLPGSRTFSVSSFGCNFTCLHCQNYELSQVRAGAADDVSVPASPEEVVSAAVSAGCLSVSFTYNEPTVSYEFMYDVAKLAHASGLQTAMITNGYMTEEALRDIAPYMDAVRVDLKAFSDGFYRKVCGGARLHPVLDTVVCARELRRHVELVTLLIPGMNDSREEIARMFSWELEALGPAVPHHFTGFRPMFHMMDVPATTVDELDYVFRAAKSAGLWYPYVGNVRHAAGSRTVCPACGNVVIERDGYSARMSVMSGGRCSVCGLDIEGVFGAERTHRF
ncbi:MAG: AmmeMemoRadiSam system radical SAM enzyme [Methanocorpusculum sp.]|nr:AmmeMemoRadiSam system radical SAM enzyme [Methanocorpusculum sp.]